MRGLGLALNRATRGDLVRPLLDVCQNWQGGAQSWIDADLCWAEFGRSCSDDGGLPISPLNGPSWVEFGQIWPELSRLGATLTDPWRRNHLFRSERWSRKDEASTGCRTMLCGMVAARLTFPWAPSSFATYSLIVLGASSRVVPRGHRRASYADAVVRTMSLSCVFQARYASGSCVNIARRNAAG